MVRFASQDFDKVPSLAELTQRISPCVISLLYQFHLLGEVPDLLGRLWTLLWFRPEQS